MTATKISAITPVEAETANKRKAGKGTMLSENQRTILDILRRTSGITRAAIPGRTSLTQQSVHRIIDQLLEAELVRMGEAPRGGPGKPSPLIALNPRASYSLGLLINTDSVVLSLKDLTCATVSERREPMDMTGRRRALERISLLFEEMIKSAGLDRRRFCGMGFTMPGYFINEEKAFNAPEPLQDWSLIDLRPELSEIFGLEAHVENSATTGAVGEALNGAGQRFSSFAYLGFDYGFGGGIVLNGSPLLGRHGNAGEFSTIYLTQQEQNDRPALRFLVDELRAHGVDVPGVGSLRQNFDPRWPGVSKWIDRILPQLRRIIYGLQGILDPDAIVFGGQIPPVLADMLIARIGFDENARYGHPLPAPHLVKGQTDGEPAATGAALLALKERFFL